MNPKQNSDVFLGYSVIASAGLLVDPNIVPYLLNLMVEGPHYSPYPFLFSSFSGAC